MVSKINYMGKPIAGLSKKELIEALEDALYYSQRQGETIHALSELAQKTYKPTTFLGRLIFGK